MPTDPRVDQYLANSPAFAQPILHHLRDLVHQACPDVVETMKWSRPAFLYGDKILFGMSAFQAHCAFGFWHPEMTKRLLKEGIAAHEGAGSLGRITQMTDLPSDRDLLRYMREALRFQKEMPAKNGAQKRVAAPKTEVVVPDDLAAALANNEVAAQTFHAFSPSHRREYTNWITEAKREETRQKRISTAVTWLSEGKPLNWKYMNC